MKLTLSVKQIIQLVAVGLILVFILSVRGKYRREVDRLNLSLYSAQNEVTESKIKIKDLEVKVFKSEAQVVSSQKALKKSEEEKEYLRKLHITDVKTISNLELRVSVLEKQGTYRDTVIMRDTITKVIDTVKTASYKDEWVTASVLLYPDKPMFTFSLYSPVKVYVGYEGLFRNKPTVSVTSPNPYINIDKANTIIVEDKKPLCKMYPYILVGIAMSAFFLK